MRVVFLGTPDFSVGALQALVDNNYEVVAVVTQPDKARNRGVISYSPVKEKALELGLKVLQYNKIRVEGVDDLKALKPDIMVTCAYGQIISQEILDIAPHGVINVHASLLTKYRGSSPIQWSILNGDKKTGVTIMQTSLGIDSGDIILQKEVDIKDNETAGELFDRLSELGAKALIEALELICNNKETFTKQDESMVSHVSMIKKEDGKINWNKSAQEISWLVRGMNPWPSAFTYIRGKMFKIWEARVENENIEEMANMPVASLYIQNKRCFVKCNNSILELLTVQMEGKKRMDAKSFLAGFRLEGEEQFDNE